MNEYRELSFEAGRRFNINPRMATAALSVIAFSILWWTVPSNRLYWPLAISLAIFTWMASYGWQQALASLIRFLESLKA